METSHDLSVWALSVQMIKGSGWGFLAEQEPSILGALRDKTPAMGYPPLKSQPRRN